MTFICLSDLYFKYIRLDSFIIEYTLYLRFDSNNEVNIKILLTNILEWPIIQVVLRGYPAIIICYVTENLVNYYIRVYL